MNKKIKEGLEMDMTTYKKVKGTLDPKTPIKITGLSPVPSLTEDGDTLEPEAVITPQDKATIKYLSNVKDAKTGKVSKPFNINGKNYQMIRGEKPSKEIVMAVFCHDDLNESGENIIHSVEYFDENIAKPIKDGYDYAAAEREYHDKEELSLIEPTTVKEFDYAGQEREFADKEAFMDYLNLTDLVGFKHFFVNIKTGELTAKFKNTKDMIKSGVKLGPNEDYMDVKGLKRFRFGDYFKGDVNEAPVNPEDAGTDVPKLQSDVKKLANLIKNKFSVYLSKLDKPIEQAQFLTAMATEIGVPLNKLSTIITSYKDIAQDGGLDKTTTAESKVLTKNELIKETIGKRVIKTVKIKNIK